ncbi:MAG: TIM barrel protein [Candidatus Bathyarchaeota archaeon]|nr:TIM barrel protein [Candidatus Bathyarchaeota archaeon]
MADHPRFGPAGIPPLFKILGAELADVPKLLREEGLDAFEYQAVRWGQTPQLKREDAEALGAEAKKNDVWLSVHGSYYVNLCGKREVVDASKRRLIAGATAAKWMNASILVFHLGFYGRMEKSYAFRSCVDALKDVIETLKRMSIKNVQLGPETMGRVFQVGTLDEILAICEEVEQTQPVIDWSHLYARQQGRLRRINDFRMVVEEVERRLGTEAARNMHCHFSRIEYTPKGERRHHVLDEKRYGPEFETLAEVIAEFRMRPVIICETPLLDVDARKMRVIFQSILKKRENAAES